MLWICYALLKNRAQVLADAVDDQLDGLAVVVEAEPVVCIQAEVLGRQWLDEVRSEAASKFDVQPVEVRLRRSPGICRQRYADVYHTFYTRQEQTAYFANTSNVAVTEFVAVRDARLKGNSDSLIARCRRQRP